MSNPLAETRKAQLQMLIPGTFKTQDEADEKLGLARGYTSFILTGRKVMGEKIARRAEVSAKLPPGYFDGAAPPANLNPGQSDLMAAVREGVSSLTEEQARAFAMLIRSSTTPPKP